MLLKSLLTSAVTAFVAAAVVGVLVLPGEAARDVAQAAAPEEVHPVELTTAPASEGPPTSVGVLDMARTYAREHGLVDCVDPAQARLDDVVLTHPGDPLAGVGIRPVGFDAALESARVGRWNVLACAVGEVAPE